MLVIGAEQVLLAVLVLEETSIIDMPGCYLSPITGRASHAWATSHCSYQLSLPEIP